MLLTNSVEHLGKNFPLRTILLSSPETFEVAGYTIGSLELQNSLIDAETGEYRSNLARCLDEQIYFYVSRAELQLDDATLAELVAHETDLIVPD
ncbi:MAG TPA: hypothetical protein VK171_16665, partial [Fimbriimonas sp.]|nr:hypothetical protein [Fimbriimonas sp.]